MTSREAIRVLIVDDSAVVRAVLREGLGHFPDLEVAGVAHNGRQGLEMVASLRPDAVVLDVQMPEMTGLEFLDRLPSEDSRRPVVLVFSSGSKEHTELTMECLSRGAQEFLDKPDPARTGMREPLDQKLSEVAHTLRGLVRGREKSRARSGGMGGRTPLHHPGSGIGPDFRPDLVVVGSSTGGPRILPAVLEGMPRLGRIRTPILLVQHMAPGFTAAFADRLGRFGALAWREAADGEKPPLGKGLVAPGGSHLRVSRSRRTLQVHLDQAPRMNSCRPSVDALFTSAADLPGTRVLAIVLSGMGWDGLAGAQRVREAGGAVVVQDEASSAVWGMPGVIVEAGIHHAILSPGEIGHLLGQVLFSGHGAPARALPAGG